MFYHRTEFNDHARPLIPYRWTGIDRRNQRIQGETHAKNAVQLDAALRHQGVLPISIKPCRWFFRRVFQTRLSEKSRLYFTQQIAILLRAGIPLAQALGLITQSEIHPAWKPVLVDVKTQLEHGSSLSDALRQHPRHFDVIYCHFITLGEHTGTLDTVLAYLAVHQEKTLRIKAKIKTALRYPLMILCIAITVTTALFLFVVPQFEHLFSSFGADLPPLTRAIIQFGQLLKQHGITALIAGGIAILTSSYVFKRSRTIAYFFDTFLISLPYLGQQIKKIFTTQFTQTLATTLIAGLPLHESLNLLAQTLPNRVYQAAIQRIQLDISSGQTLHAAMQITHLFSHLTLLMIRIGEESGTLSTMLTNIANTYEEDIQQQIDRFHQLLEPAMILLLSILVGGLIMGLYLPIFKLGSVIHGQ